MDSLKVVPINSRQALSVAVVLDLAVGVAIGRDLADNENEIGELVEQWFMRPSSTDELNASLDRLITNGWIEKKSEASCGFCLTIKGIDAATTLTGGLIRMIDRGRGHFKVSYLLSQLELEKGECT